MRRNGTFVGTRYLPCHTSTRELVMCLAQGSKHVFVHSNQATFDMQYMSASFLDKPLTWYKIRVLGIDCMACQEWHDHCLNDLRMCIAAATKFVEISDDESQDESQDESHDETEETIEVESQDQSQDEMEESADSMPQLIPASDIEEEDDDN